MTPKYKRYGKECEKMIREIKRELGGNHPYSEYAMWNDIFHMDEFPYYGELGEKKVEAIYGTFLGLVDDLGRMPSDADVVNYLASAAADAEYWLTVIDEPQKVSEEDVALVFRWMAEHLKDLEAAP